MNANDSLREHTSSETMVQHPFGPIYTEGVKALCDKFECWWFLNIIVSYQHEAKFRKEEFQVWKLIRTGDAAVVTCEDGNGNRLCKQKIHYTDFKPTEATVWVEFKTILLPSEH